jgi:antitoxin MazE
MIGHVMKWGNSLGVLIPKAIAQQMGVEAGAAIDIKMVGHGLFIKKKYDLDELLAGVTPENIHEETQLGKPVGKELW